tara:strand:+ start:1298 stop:1456 length:159 start_codon:yes stop_codon:yes gene_type:complete
MVRDSFTKIAYNTLQQGKSIAGLAHKEISSKVMNLLSPDEKLNDFNIDKDFF